MANTVTLRRGDDRRRGGMIYFRSLLARHPRTKRTLTMGPPFCADELTVVTEIERLRAVLMLIDFGPSIRLGRDDRANVTRPSAS